MNNIIKVEFPESLANTLRFSGEDFKSEMKKNSLIKLFELGKISSNVAAKVLGLSRVEFLELLSNYKVSVFGAYDVNDLNEDIANA